MHFIGRLQELDLLKKAWEKRESAFIPIYGRRRVGKSELILNFINNLPNIYFLGKQAPPQLQIKEFMQQAAKSLDEPLLAQITPTDWKTALKTALSKTGPYTKLILALDEFQWIAKASPELPSVLQELWDRKWQKSGQIMLIICGSYMGFMEKEILGSKSPLFGRRTAQILLQPFSYREAALFFPGWSLSDCTRAYFICGGVPYYLKAFDKYKSIATNIQHQILDQFSPLFREPDFLLREELKELERYFAVLMALATNSLSIGNIAKQTGIPEKNLYYYLQNLIELQYVKRKYPLTNKKPSARNVRFEICEPLLSFWFRFIYPNISFISQSNPDKAYQTLIEPYLNSYFGYCFEKLCREAMPLIYSKEDIQTSFEVGEYWDKYVQIDLVGYRQDHRIDIGECKWGGIKSMLKASQELRGKIEKYPNPDNETIQPRIFTRTRIKDNQKLGIICHCLEDLYSNS